MNIEHSTSNIEWKKMNRTKENEGNEEELNIEHSIPTCRETSNVQYSRPFA